MVSMAVKKVIDMPTKDREIIVIYDKLGGTGKSELAKRLRYESKAVYPSNWMQTSCTTQSL